MVTELETETKFLATVDSASLRDARQEVEEELGDIEVSVDAVAQTSGSSGSGSRSGRDTGPGTISETNSYLDELDGLAIERNDLLRELLEETEMGNRTGGRGGGGLGGGLLGLLGIGVGAGALGLSGLTDALNSFDPELPDLDIPGSIPVDAPEDIPVDAPENIPLDAPENIPLDAPRSIPLSYPASIPLDAASAAATIAEAQASVRDPEPTTGPDPTPAPEQTSGSTIDPESERAILNDAPTGYEQTTVAPAEDPAERSTLRGQAAVAGAGAIADGVDFVTGYDERVRESAAEAWNAPFPTMNPNMPAERATTGEGVRRLGSATLAGGAGLTAASLLGGGAARAGLGAAMGLAGASGITSAEQPDNSGNRSTTRREETNVTIEVDARESRNTREVAREIQRKLPELERRLSQLEGALSGRR